MTHSTFCSLVLVGTLIGIAAPVYAQQTSDAAKPSATPPAAAPAAAPAPAASAAPTATKTSAATDTSDVPPADMLKKARNGGFHTKVAHGVVFYCKSEADVGSRFSTEHCYNENQLSELLIQQQSARDQFTNRACSGGCSGK